MDKLRALTQLEGYSLGYVGSLIGLYTTGTLGVPALIVVTSVYVLIVAAAHRHVSRTPRRQLRYEDALWRYLTAKEDNV